MPLNSEILNKLKCCLNSDGHIAIEPVLLKCKGNACRNCIDNFDEIKGKCNYGNCKHKKNEALNAPVNEIVQLLIKQNLEELFDYLEPKIQSVKNDIQGILNLI